MSVLQNEVPKSTFYKSNHDFVIGESEAPINIDEIRYSLMIGYYGKIYTNLPSRLLRGIALYIFTIVWVWLWTSSMLVSLQSKQYQDFLCLSIPVFASTVMVLGYAIQYILGKASAVERRIKRLYEYGVFYEGKVFSTLERPEGTELYYMFSTKDRQNIVGSYILRDRDHKFKESVVIWYTDYDDITHTLV